MQISPNFSLAELTKSQMALRHEIDNTPGEAEIANLKLVAENILQPLRDHYGVPFAPSSGFRCLELNRVLNSKDTSQHVKGQAVDIEIPGVSNYELAIWIRDNLRYDQLILECYTSGDPASGWVHCSYVGADNRTVALTYANRSFSEGLIA